MTRFGQAFINSLTNPSYGQGLFTAAQQFGAAPAVAREKQQRSKAMEIVNQALASNNPEQLLQAAEAIKGFDPQSAMKLSQAAGQIRQQGIAALEQGQQEIQQNLSTARQQASERTRRQRLEDNAVALAKRMNPKNPAVAQGLIGADEATLREYLMTAGKTDSTDSSSDRFKVVGNNLFDVQEKRFIETPQVGKDTKSTFNPQELAKSGKYTVKSIQEALDAGGDFSLLVSRESSKPDTVGEIPPTVEKRNNEIRQQAAESSVQLGFNRQLQNQLMSNPSKATGILSEMRTFVLDMAGQRDAEEEAKTNFLRERNLSIVNSLPPGVASDRDIELFSAGFPSVNASTEEITRYLQASERILAAQSDMAILAEQHIEDQVTKGQKATMIGFESKKRSYGNLMLEVRKDIEAARAAGNVELENQIIEAASQALGFTPRLYQ